MREVHFGKLFRCAQQASCNETLSGTVCSRDGASNGGLTHISRFIESFEAPEQDLWLVGGTPYVAAPLLTTA